MDIRRIAAIKDGEKHIGNRTRVKIAKNKVAPPFGQVEFDIMYGEGISKTGDLLDLAVSHGFVEKAGAWFSYDNNKMGQGRENSKQFLKDNPEIFDELKKKILAKNGLGSKEDMALYSGEVVDESTGEILDEDLTEAAATTKKSKKTKKTLQ